MIDEEIKGLVIRTTDIKESDRLITIYSEEADGYLENIGFLFQPFPDAGGGKGGKIVAPNEGIHV